MLDKNKVKKLSIILTAYLGLNISNSLGEGLEPPPELSLVDRNEVNLISGQRAVTLHDLSIGTGDMQLSHTIATYQDFLQDFSMIIWGESAYFPT